MELVRGEDLRRVLHREGRIEPSRASRILSAVCGAIDAAHAAGVLHRDLKPENILLPGGEVEAKVLDFGVAKLVEGRHGDAPVEPQATLTVAGTIVGTPAYMAPEQLRAGPPDARTDVFALGVIAYEMLSGDLPFSRGSLTDVILAQARGAPALTGRDAAVPPAPGSRDPAGAQHDARGTARHAAGLRGRRRAGADGGVVSLPRGGDRSRRAPRRSASSAPGSRSLRPAASARLSPASAIHARALSPDRSSAPVPWTARRSASRSSMRSWIRASASTRPSPDLTISQE
jgi:serine/threonine protein kinase